MASGPDLFGDEFLSLPAADYTQPVALKVYMRRDQTPIGTITVKNDTTIRQLRRLLFQNKFINKTKVTLHKQNGVEMEVITVRVSVVFARIR